MNSLLARLKNSSHTDSEIDDEMRFHLEMQIKDNLAAGMNPEEARQAAYRSFGNVASIQETTREIWGFPWLETLWQDVHFGVRMLTKAKGFTAIAVLSLGLGIGGVSSIFSVVNAVLLRPLPFKDADRLVMIETGGAPVSTVMHWEEHSHVVEQMGDITIYGNNWILLGDRPRQVLAHRIGPNVLQMLGVEPIRGRTFLPSEPSSEESNSFPVVISYGFWQSHFAGEVDVIGRTLTFPRATGEVVGVMPAGFYVFPWKWAYDVDLWIPRNHRKWDPGSRVSRLIGRLNRGSSVEEAQAELETLTWQVGGLPSPADGMAASNPDRQRISVETLEDRIRGSNGYRQNSFLFMVAVSFVLLIACCNVVGLALARATVRRKEMAVRAALGAGRMRLVRQLLTESVLLGLLGGAVGVMLGLGGIRLFNILNPGWYSADEIRMDGLALTVTMAVSLLTGILLGLLPALKGSKPNLNEWLAEGSRSSTSGSRLLFHGVLVVSQVAVAVVLLVGAGLMMNSLLQFLQTDRGFDPEHLMRMQMQLSDQKYFKQDDQIDKIHAQAGIFFQQLLERIDALPEVTSVCMGGLHSRGMPIRILGHPDPSFGESTPHQRFADYREISPDYFVTLKTPILKGRQFNEGDREGAAGVAIVNETFARQFFPNEDPIGKTVQASFLSPPNSSPDRIREVVGVVRDRTWYGPEDREAGIFVPFLQHPWEYPRSLGRRFHLQKEFFIRTASDPERLTSKLPELVAELDKDQFVQVETMKHLISRSANRYRFLARLYGLFAGLALFLAAVGLYGVVSYSVAQRTHEFGIRMALGARRREVLAQVLKKGLALSLGGVALGVVFAAGLSRFIESQLFGVTPIDPLTFGLVSLLLVAVALFASYLPARRATKIDPLEALRYE